MSHPDPSQAPGDAVAVLPEADFVPVFYAHTRREADRLCALLIAHGMVATVGAGGTGPMQAFSPGRPILIERSEFDRASELLAMFEAQATTNWDEDEEDTEDFDDEEDEDDAFDEDEDLDLDEEDEFDDDDDEDDDDFDLDVDGDDEL